MRKWIVFKADDDQPHWETRQYAHTGALTDILAEHYDCSDAPLPVVGYRPPEFMRVEQFEDPKSSGASTHYRPGDWEVVRVETYVPDVPVATGFDLIAVCYCQYNPIAAPLHPIPTAPVSVDSFGGDAAAYQEWQESQKQTAPV